MSDIVVKKSDIDTVKTQYNTETGTFQLGTHKYHNLYEDVYTGEVVITHENSYWLDRFSRGEFSGALNAKDSVIIRSSYGIFDTNLKDQGDRMSFSGKMAIDGKWNVYGNLENGRITIIYAGKGDWHKHIYIQKDKTPFNSFIAIDERNLKDYQ